MDGCSAAESTLSDDDDDSEEEAGDEDDRRHDFSFPDLDAQIRACISDYGAVFPKLNFSSPKDASWVLPMSSPLKCTCPADVYLLLKSSDFITHDLNGDNVFEGTLPSSSDSDSPKYELELVLRKWYPIDRSREFRCFVRDNTLIGISQRDPNFYDFMIELSTQDKILSSIQTFFEENIKHKMLDTRHYIFDFLLTRDLSRGHIVDFNSFSPRTDPLLFTYEELLDLYIFSISPDGNTIQKPKLALIDSRAHPAANRKAPANQHNMLPFDALQLSSGRDIADFAKVWEEEMRNATAPDGENDRSNSVN